MPQISKQKTDKITEQVLFYLFQSFPRQLFTSDIAKELARDEEFIKKLMLEMLKKELVVKVDKNPTGEIYKKRLRWRLSNKVYDIYKQQNQNKSNQVQTTIEKEQEAAQSTE